MTQEEWTRRTERLNREYDAFKSFEHLDELVTESHEILNWSDFEHWASKHSAEWSFRGHGDSEWCLTSTFDREIRQTITVKIEHLESSGVGRLYSVENEKQMLLWFQQAAQLSDAPQPGNTSAVRL